MAADVAGADVDAFLTAHGFAPGEIDAADKRGMTPLMHAARQGPAGLVRAILGAGARVDAVNGDWNQPLWLACVSDDPDILDLIIGAGADLDHANANGVTALMYAASAGRARAVARLVAAGADLDLDVDGMTAMDMAATLECLQLLRTADRARRAQC
jgi:ankyrin repeat protein